MHTIKTDAIFPCPFINCGDGRCSKRLNLGSIDQAFSVCLGEYKSCPIYSLLVAQKARAASKKLAVPALLQQRAVA